MDKIPQETFTSIISHLVFSDQLTCIRVCKRWYQIIGSTSLFRDVSFESSRNRIHDPRFEKAYTLFNENEHLGQATINLTLINFEPQAFFILSLPRLFPNVQHLIWDDDDDDRRIDFPTITFYAPEFRRWQHLTSIEARTNIPIAAFILESSTFTNLTTLSIDFYKLHNDVTEQASGYAKSVLKNVKNAPALKTIELSTLQLDLHDMENLHNDVPHLEQVELIDISLGNLSANRDIIITDNGRSLLNKEGEEFVQATASKVNKFELHLGKKLDHETLLSWLLYPGLKYNNVEAIRFSCGNDSNVSSNRIDYDQPIGNAISNMINMKDYYTDLIPITSSILRAMDKTNVKLNKLTLYVEDDNDVESQLAALQSSSQVQHIKKLLMHTRVINNTNPEIFGRAINRLNNPYSSLVSLEINLPSTHHGCLLALLQNAPPVLETLDYFSIIMYDDDDYFQAVTRRTPQLSNLKMLILTIAYHCNFRLENWNKTFKSLIQLCPKLTIFDLYGQGFMDCHDNVFNLDLTPLRKLKSIKINIDNFDYYKFNLDDRCWVDCQTLWNKTPSSEELCVNLAWNGEPSLDISKMS